MKAIVCTEYGSPEVLQLQEVETPTPKDREVLIKVRATTVTSADVRIRKADPFPIRFFYGFLKPKPNLILGSDLSGEIVAVGKDVTRFQVGDLIFAGTETNLSANAEYICLPETDAIAIRPAHITDEEAAAIPFGAITSLIFLRDKGKIHQGQSILIYGASGALGTAAVQLAQYFGATVTGVCSAANLELVKSLGADEVIDYIQEDFTQRGKTYDMIFDTVGKSPFSGCLRSLKPEGIYLRAVHIDLFSILRGLWTSMTRSQKVIGGIAIGQQADLMFLKELIEAGQLKAVIDRRYPLAQTAEAHRYAEQGHKRGSVVITLE
jgi:NADPH:quinone reductase-like Zn-dependent oxidoreductase